MIGVPAILESADIKDLPPFAQELVSLIGSRDTLLLVGTRPGVPIYIPAELSPEHALNSIAGPEAARILVKHYPGETIIIPNCKLALTKIRQKNILKSRKEGYSQTEVALLHGVTPRWVRELESRVPKTEWNLKAP